MTYTLMLITGILGGTHLYFFPMETKEDCIEAVAVIHENDQPYFFNDANIYLAKCIEGDDEQNRNI